MLFKAMPYNTDKAKAESMAEIRAYQGTRCKYTNFSE